MSNRTPWPHDATDRVHQLMGEIAQKELEAARLRECVRSLQLAARRVYDDVGTPGDFGYETRTGKALKHLYDTYNASLKEAR